MDKREVTTTAVVLGILAVLFTTAPVVLATISASSYPYELTGRIEYVAPVGTPNPFGHAGQAVFDYAQPVALAEPVAWVPASSYSTSPGHGL